MLFGFAFSFLSNFLRFDATLSRIHLIVVIDALFAHRTVAQTILVVCNVAQPTILFTINSCFNPIRQAAVVVIVFSPSYLFCIVVFHVSKTHTHSLAVSAHCHLVCKIKVPTIYITLNDSYWRLREHRVVPSNFKSHVVERVHHSMAVSTAATIIRHISAYNLC